MKNSEDRFLNTSQYSQKLVALGATDITNIALCINALVKNTNFKQCSKFVK